MPSPPFDVYPFSEDHLYRDLSNDLLVPAEVAEHGGAKYLSAYLKAVGAQTILVEYDYTDADYLDDFAVYYVKCFQSYLRRCKRLHFFADSLTHDQLVGWVESSEPTSKSGGFRRLHPPYHYCIPAMRFRQACKYC